MPTPYQKQTRLNRNYYIAEAKDDSGIIFDDYDYKRQWQKQKQKQKQKQW